MAKFSLERWAQKQREDARGLTGRSSYRTPVHATTKATTQIDAARDWVESETKHPAQATVEYDPLRARFIGEAPHASGESGLGWAEEEEGWPRAVAQIAMERMDHYIDECRYYLGCALRIGDMSEADMWMGKLAEALAAKHQRSENKIKATIHKAGHFPTQWMEEAIDRAEASEKCITLSVERKGVMVTAIEGDDKYASHVITWQQMENAEVNPLLLAIEDVEKKLDVLHRVKEKVA